MRIVFMGTPEIAVPSLDALCGEHEVVLVVTQPDKPAGRGHHLQAPPVKTRAAECGIAVAQPERARDEGFVEQLRAVAPAAIAVVAYGQILPRAILELAPRGCVNSHFSLLPRWRGAAPVQHSLWAGDRATGITTQWMAPRLDSGDVILQQEVPIEPEETAGELLLRLTPLGAAQLLETMRRLEAGDAPRLPQDESAVTLAPSLQKEDGRIEWSRPAHDIANHVRAFNPWPGTWCDFRDGILKVWRATVVVAGHAEGGHAARGAAAGSIVAIEEAGVTVATGQGQLRLVEVQAAGRPRMNASDWARGARLAPGRPLVE